MNARVRKRVVIAGVAALGLSTLAAAGVVRHWRMDTERGLSDERQRLAMLRLRFAQVETPSTSDAAPACPWRLLEDPGVVETLQELQRLGDEAGIVLDEQKALRSPGEGKQVYAINGHGAPGAVGAFLAAIEQDGRLMIVETGRFTPMDERHVRFELGLATYHHGGGR